MKIVDKLIEAFVTKILKDMEQISEELHQEVNLPPIDKAKQDLANKEMFKKLNSRQALLSDPEVKL